MRRRPRESEPAPDAAQPDVCPLCERTIPAHARASRHHLTPKLKGGVHRDTVRLHQICHSAIHARYSEAEIARRLADIENLRRDPALAGFLAWVRTKPEDFHARPCMTRDRRQRRHLVRW